VVGGADGVRISARCEEDALARALQVRSAIGGIRWRSLFRDALTEVDDCCVLVEPKGGSMSSERGSKKVKRLHAGVKEGHAAKIC
jgi:hypothetical protein